MASAESLRIVEATPSYGWNMPGGPPLAPLSSSEVSVAMSSLYRAASVTQGIMGSRVWRLTDAGSVRASTLPEEPGMQPAVAALLLYREKGLAGQFHASEARRQHMAVMGGPETSGGI